MIIPPLVFPGLTREKGSCADNVRAVHVWSLCVQYDLYEK
jgi:hypothetical protein